MLDGLRQRGYSFTMNRIRAIMHDMGHGYRNLAVRTGFTVLALAGLALISAAIALPLWALATYAKAAYSYFVLAILAVWALAALFFDWRKSMRQGTPARKLVSGAISFIVRAITVIMGILAIPFMAGMVQTGNWLIAIPTALLYVIFAGLIFFAKPRR